MTPVAAARGKSEARHRRRPPDLALPSGWPESARVARGTHGGLHLRHGPIELIVEVEAAEPGVATAAYRAAVAAFAPILHDLVAELPALRRPVADGLDPAGRAVTGPVARRMGAAVAPHAAVRRLTPMAAVAGAVSDTLLAAMRRAGPLRRASVNNGGDIALALAPDERATIGIAAPDGRRLGRLVLRGEDGIGGIATSGRGGRSHSLGIADAVTVLGADAAGADAAATLIANAVDLPGHPAVRRRPARDLDPDSDLGDAPVTVGLGPIDDDEARAALAHGLRVAESMRRRGLIVAAALFLQGQARSVGPLSNDTGTGGLPSPALGARLWS